MRVLSFLKRLIAAAFFFELRSHAIAGASTRPYTALLAPAARFNLACWPCKRTLQGSFVARFKGGIRSACPSSLMVSRCVASKRARTALHPRVDSSVLYCADGSRCTKESSVSSAACLVRQTGAARDRKRAAIMHIAGPLIASRSGSHPFWKRLALFVTTPMRSRLGYDGTTFERPFVEGVCVRETPGACIPSSRTKHVNRTAPLQQRRVLLHLKRNTRR